MPNNGLKIRFPEGHDPDWIPTDVRDSIRRRLAAARLANIRYDDEQRFVFGFMGTTPHSAAVEAYTDFLPEHPNNIGEHTCGIDELGFPGTQRIEAEVIGMLGDLHGDPNVNGYLTLDGTEANIQAMWVGRDWLLGTCGSPGDPRVSLVVSHLGHYSFRKAYDLLRLWGSFIALPTDERGSVRVDAMEKSILDAYYSGERRFIIVSIGGSTMLGSVDDTAAIGCLVERLEKQLNHSLPDRSPDRVGFFIHTDAAFGGFVTPFLDPPILTGFNAHPLVRSMTIDPHKMGLSVYPGGTYLCRRGLIEVVSSPVSYIGGGRNVTIAGSRPGAEAAACWAVFNALGRRGYKALVRRCMATTLYLERRLRALPWLRVWPPTLNIVTFDFRGFTEQEVKERSRKLCNKYTLVPGSVASDLGRPYSQKTTVFHCVLMPHRWLLEQGERVIDEFVLDLTTAFTVSPSCHARPVTVVEAPALAGH